jgi:hypothetical protein
MHAQGGVHLVTQGALASQSTLGFGLQPLRGKEKSLILYPEGVADQNPGSARAVRHPGNQAVMLPFIPNMSAR